MKIVAQGILAHKFHGSYSAVIALQFVNEEEARLANSILGQNWQVGKDEKNILVALFDSEGVEQFKIRFTPKCKPCEWRHCKGKIHEIDGLNHSVDIGSPFDLILEVEDKNQLKLF